MSIKIHQLTKIYGQQKAIDQLSFQVQPGEIVGFLGPNGAGKTTTMKIISGYLNPTSGNASVCGFDSQKDSMEVRKRIGYLPEHNPLYLDLYVREYLTFIARLHQLDQTGKRINDVIERTGLGQESHKKVRMLSKGYRQRVGLAQAMIHEPEVYILDEPTSGLDPNQLVEIRRLIKDLGANKTVIFSTHIMQEVQAICDRVMIINQGKMVADGSIDLVKDNTSKERCVEVLFSREVNKYTLSDLEVVSRVEEMEGNRFLIYSKRDEDIRPAIFDFAVSRTLQIIEMFEKQTTVEDVFQKLTKKKG